MKGKKNKKLFVVMVYSTFYVLYTQTRIHARLKVGKCLSGLLAVVFFLSLFFLEGKRGLYFFLFLFLFLFLLFLALREEENGSYIHTWVPR